jgi:hypothetical protein
MRAFGDDGEVEPCSKAVIAYCAAICRSGHYAQHLFFVLRLARPLQRIAIVAVRKA